MNYLHLAKAVIGFYFFMKRHTANYGDPIYLSEEECQKIYENIKADKYTKNRYFFVMDIRTSKIKFEYNMEKFLPYKKKYTVDDSFKATHPDYLLEVLMWAETTFRYVTTELKLSQNFKPMEQHYRVTIPIKMKDGKYHWMLQDTSPLQFDKNNNVVTVMNTFTMVRPFITGEKIPLMGTLYDENFDQIEWNQAFWKMFFLHKPFVLTPEQDKIIEILTQNSDLSNTEIAEKLNKKKNTIDIQNKQILDRARESFKNEKFENVREVVSFLKSVQFFSDGYFATHSTW